MKCAARRCQLFFTLIRILEQQKDYNIFFPPTKDYGKMLKGQKCFICVESWVEYAVEKCDLFSFFKHCAILGQSYWA